MNEDISMLKEDLNGLLSAYGDYNIDFSGYIADKGKDYVLTLLSFFIINENRPDLQTIFRDVSIGVYD